MSIENSEAQRVASVRTEIETINLITEAVGQLRIELKAHKMGERMLQWLNARLDEQVALLPKVDVTKIKPWPEGSAPEGQPAVPRESVAPVA